MSRILKTISMDLSTQSVDKAIREINAFKKQLTDYCNDLIQRLVEDGVVVAKMKVMQMNAVYTGALEESIEGIYSKDKRIGIILTSKPYAVYVEYGTGIVGLESPHPDPQSANWEYDVNQHGEKGWLYLKKTDNGNKFRWTKGMPARPFMFNTLRWLEQNAPAIASELLSQF